MYFICILHVFFAVFFSLFSPIKPIFSVFLPIFFNRHAARRRRARDKCLRGRAPGAGGVRVGGTGGAGSGSGGVAVGPLERGGRGGSNGTG
jgi:hypothetical protein